jgi:DnaJ-class molecular chaperone
MVKDSKEFVRKDDDLISRKEITLLEAIRGESNLQVDSIDGPCRVQIPPGSQNNQQIIISNKVNE